MHFGGSNKTTIIVDMESSSTIITTFVCATVCPYDFKIVLYIKIIGLNRLWIYF